MIHQPRHAAINGIGENMPFGDGNRGQVDPVGDITNGVDRRHRGHAVFINGDSARLIGFDPHRFQPQPVGHGLAASRHHERIRRNGCAIREGNILGVIVTGHAGNRAAGMQDDAARLHRLSQALAQILIKAAQGQISPVDKMGFGTKAIENPGKFNRDIACTKNHNLIRAIAQLKRFIG